MSDLDTRGLPIRTHHTRTWLCPRCGKKGVTAIPDPQQGELTYLIRCRFCTAGRRVKPGQWQGIQQEIELICTEEDRRRLEQHGITY